MALGARLRRSEATQFVQIGDMVLGEKHEGELVVGIITSFRPEANVIMVMSDDLDACVRVWALCDITTMIIAADEAFKSHRTV